MTIQELEEAMKEAAANYKSFVAALNELQEKESNLEAAIEGLQDELDELRNEEIQYAEDTCRFARDKFDYLTEKFNNLIDEHNKRSKLKGIVATEPVVYRCG